MKKILILGKGYVGNNLFESTSLSNSEYVIHSKETLDYTNLSILNKFLLNNNITHVVNCFGFTGRPNVDECESRKEECWQLNVMLPLSVSKLCESLKVQYIHISSGCIYTGYYKEYTENDMPNFGMFNDSSFYSKSKHAFEMWNNYGCTIRVRMPFCNELSDRSYLTKILKYDNLINFKNSKTYIPDLCRFVNYIIDSDIQCNDIGVINFVNPSAKNTTEVVEALTAHDLVNPNWKFVDVEELNLAAPRSNCVLAIDKLKKLFPEFKINTEQQAFELALSNI
jgi:dTDP-4-dehydrorhamnose reductase